jgi:hypothetical protein
MEWFWVVIHRIVAKGPEKGENQNVKPAPAPKPVKIQKTVFFFEGDNTPKICDTIAYDGKLWLVALWNHMPQEKCSMPARIICLDKLPYRKLADPSGIEYRLLCSIPKAVFDGQGRGPHPLGIEFVVVENPDLHLPILR